MPSGKLGFKKEIWNLSTTCRQYIWNNNIINCYLTEPKIQAAFKHTRTHTYTHTHRERETFCENENA